MCGTEAETSHLVRQRSVSIAAILSIKARRVVVLNVPGSVPVAVAVAVVVVVGGGRSGMSVIQVSGLWSGLRRGLRRLRFRGV